MSPAQVLCLFLFCGALTVVFLAFLAQRQIKQQLEGEASTLGGFERLLNTKDYLGAIMWLGGCVLVRIILNRGWIVLSLLAMGTAASVCAGVDFLAFVQWLFGKTCDAGWWPPQTCRDSSLPVPLK